MVGMFGFDVFDLIREHFKIKNSFLILWKWSRIWSEKSKDMYEKHTTLFTTALVQLKYVLL